MVWNGSDKGKDPWGRKSEPPDLEEIIKRITQKFKRSIRGNSSTSSSNSNNPKQLSFGPGIILFFGVFFLLWFLSGIFIVDPAEQAAILRFGKYVKTVGPGPHWIPRLIESKNIVNVDRVADYSYSAQMLTKDENLVSVALVVQYRIGDLKSYLFNVADPEESLQQATSSALRQVVGSTTLDQIITEGREAWGQRVQEDLTAILERYHTGIVIVNVSPQPARAPEDVQDAFDDAIKAQEDEKRFKEQARAYEAKVVPIAMGKAKRIREEAQAFAQAVTLTAQGETEEFKKLLPEYLKDPKVMGERMYLETMQSILTRSSKMLIDTKASNVIYLPLNNRPPFMDAGKSANLHSEDISPVSYEGRDTGRSVKRYGREFE